MSGLITSCISVEIIAAIARACVLVICAAGSVLSIYWGWRLYKDAIASPTLGDASVGKYKVKLVAAGPGVFFAIFGMVILWKLVDRPADITIPPAAAGLEVAPSEVSEPRISQRPRSLLLTGATGHEAGSAVTKPASSPPCLIPRHIVFLTGGSVTPSVARAALGVALHDTLEKSQTANADNQLTPSISRGDAIDVLRVLKDNIDE
jgi:hypothetical protein